MMKVINYKHILKVLLIAFISVILSEFVDSFLIGLFSVIIISFLIVKFQN